MLGYEIICQCKKYQRIMECPGMDAYKVLDKWSSEIQGHRDMLTKYFEKYIKELKK